MLVLCRSVLSGMQANTPMVASIRGQLDTTNRLMTRAMFTSAEVCTTAVISRSRRFKREFPLQSSTPNRPVFTIWIVTVCHCRPRKRCHGDAIIEEFQALSPTAIARVTSSSPQISVVIHYLTRLREAPSNDEGIPSRRSVWQGHNEPMEMGVPERSRELCDGQTLAWRGRWPVAEGISYELA